MGDEAVLLRSVNYLDCWVVDNRFRLSILQRLRICVLKIIVKISVVVSWVRNVSDWEMFLLVVSFMPSIELILFLQTWVWILNTV